MSYHRILLVTLEPIAKQMAGPAIRCVEMAKQLSKEHDVTVFSPYPVDFDETSLLLQSCHLSPQHNKAHLYTLAQSSDILIIQANVLKPYPQLAQLGKYLVVDLYDPYLLAVLAQYANTKSSTSYNLMHQILKKHMESGDFFLCASKRQLDYWLGRFCALGRLNPSLYQSDPSFSRLIDIVPFGLPDIPPTQSHSAIKGKVPGIGKTDFLLLWGGGLWDWFDPLTVIKAVACLQEKYPHLKLYFMGYKSPNPQVPLMNMAVKARQLAEELNVINKSIFFSDTWIPYEERFNYLLDADVAVSAHFDVIETRFSFRTRILDYLWAGRPIFTTEGDHFADLIATQQAGMALPFQDVNAWKISIETLLNNKDLLSTFSQNSAQLSCEFHWEKAVQPLKNYCASPYHLPVCQPIKMPSLLERVHSIYKRGGKQLLLQRCNQVLQEMLRS